MKASIFQPSALLHVQSFVPPIFFILQLSTHLECFKILVEALNSVGRLWLKEATRWNSCLKVFRLWRRPDNAVSAANNKCVQQWHAVLLLFSFLCEGDMPTYEMIELPTWHGAWLICIESDLPRTYSHRVYDKIWSTLDLWVTSFCEREDEEPNFHMYFSLVLWNSVSE